MKFYVYILRSKVKDKYYVGHTNNIIRRLKEHNSGKSKFTKKYMPWELLYYEEFESQSEAITKEKYFKTTSGRRLIKKLISPGSSVG
ncbi:MAG: GIY-YIG nuclease family protein [Ignavibacterium sp.]|nr:GIY-YIG nuclease family protein [Ignavibacterium sp.]MDW8374268.1 GIY-YIG nuclease family protein [Ignavibacteriales bacterium]